MKKALSLIAVAALALSVSAASHVFWYKATTNGYNLQAASPGPALPASLTVHEGKVFSASVRQSAGDAGSGIAIGNGLDDAQGRCGAVWSQDLCLLTGTCTSAKYRAELRDGWSGNAFCNAGPIAIRCGVADFQANIDVWGTASDVADNATWQDFLNPLGSAMGYDMSNPALEAEETIDYTAPAGRPSESDPSVLDGVFAEIDITDQVNWILSHTCENKGAYSGQYAIVFISTPGDGSLGKINMYCSEEMPGTGMGSDNPWTTDANTCHLLVEGDLTVANEQGVVKGAFAGLSLGRNAQNPVLSRTTLDFNTGVSEKGFLSIYDAAGRMVFSTEVKGQGSVAWNTDGLTNGVYFSRLNAGRATVSRKLVLTR